MTDEQWEGFKDKADRLIKEIQDADGDCAGVVYILRDGLGRGQEVPIQESAHRRIAGGTTGSVLQDANKPAQPPRA